MCTKGERKQELGRKDEKCRYAMKYPQRTNNRVSQKIAERSVLSLLNLNRRICKKFNIYHVQTHPYVHLLFIVVRVILH